MKTETCKLYCGVFWIFLPNVIKIHPYNFEMYHFKDGAFFDAQFILKELQYISHRVAHHN